MPNQTKYTPANITRALRLPFIFASCLPFIFGSLIEGGVFNTAGFLLGLACLLATHLSANLINDYFDSKSRADWQDKRSFGLFGGSKLIQEGVFSEAFYLKASLFCAAVSFVCVLPLAVLLRNHFVIIIYLFIIISSWQYTAGPLRFSYRGLGEVFIFLLFGPCAVMGGYFIQSGVFPDLKSFILSLPFGFFTLAMLLANEIADCPDDKNSGKRTWPVLSGGRKAFIIYLFAVSSGFLSVLFGAYLKYLGFFSLLSLLLVPRGIGIGMNLKDNYSDKLKLIESSRQAVNLLAGISIILILSLII